MQFNSTVATTLRMTPSASSAVVSLYHTRLTIPCKSPSNCTAARNQSGKAAPGKDPRRCGPDDDGCPNAVVVSPTWEGSYAFTDEMILRIEGLPDLHVFMYRHPDREGALIDFAAIACDDNLYLLREADADIKGVTPILEGIDVLPDANRAEIIVRWRHPGQGGLRSVEKLLYSPNDLQFVTGSDFVSDGRKMKWFQMGSTAPSPPPKYKH
jgi:hypothetical protein